MKNIFTIRWIKQILNHVLHHHYPASQNDTESNVADSKANSDTSKRNDFFNRMYILLLLMGGMLTMISFQNCAKPTSLKLTSQVSNSPSMSSPDLLSNASAPDTGVILQQGKVIEAFDASVPSAVAVNQGQSLQEIQVELTKTGSGNSKLVLTESSYNQSVSDLGLLFDTRYEKSQKQYKKISLKNINTNLPTTVDVKLSFQVIDASGKITSTFVKTVSVTVLKANSGVAVNSVQPIAQQQPVVVTSQSPAAAAVSSPAVDCSANAAFNLDCIQNPVSMALQVKAIENGTDVRLRGQLTNTLLPGPGEQFQFQLTSSNGNFDFRHLGYFQDKVKIEWIYNGVGTNGRQVNNVTDQAGGRGLPKSAFLSEQYSSDFRFQTYQNLITFNSGSNDGFASYFSGTVQVKIWYNYKLIAQTNPVSILQIEECRINFSGQPIFTQAGFSGTLYSDDAYSKGISRTVHTIFHRATIDWMDAVSYNSSFTSAGTYSSTFNTSAMSQNTAVDAVSVRFVFLDAMGAPVCSSRELYYTR